MGTSAAIPRTCLASHGNSILEGSVTAEDAVERYQGAVERRGLILEAWYELGRPILATGGQTGRNVVAHPLIQMLREADLLCDRLGKSVRQRRTGRPVGASSAPDRVPEPPRITLARRGQAPRAVRASRG